MDDEKFTIEEKVFYITWVFWSLLQIVFIVLKLTKIINWSWLWVLAPIWVSVSFTVIAIIAFIIIILIMSAIYARKE